MLLIVCLTLLAEGNMSYRPVSFIITVATAAHCFSKVTLTNQDHSNFVIHSTKIMSDNEPILYMISRVLLRCCSHLI